VNGQASRNRKDVLLPKALATAVLLSGCIALSLTLYFRHQGSAVGISFSASGSTIIASVVLLHQSRQSVIESEREPRIQKAGLLALMTPIFLWVLLGIVIALLLVGGSGDGLKVAVYFEILALGLAVVWIGARLRHIAAGLRAPD
jgi:hypothetical protein